MFRLEIADLEPSKKTEVGRSGRSDILEYYYLNYQHYLILAVLTNLYPDFSNLFFISYFVISDESFYTLVVFMGQKFSLP
jgi:hypothetical protein